MNADDRKLQLLPWPLNLKGWSKSDVGLDLFIGNKGSRELCLRYRQEFMQDLLPQNA